MPADRVAPSDDAAASRDDVTLRGYGQGACCVDLARRNVF